MDQGARDVGRPVDLSPDGLDGGPLLIGEPSPLERLDGKHDGAQTVVERAGRLMDVVTQELHPGGNQLCRRLVRRQRLLHASGKLTEVRVGGQAPPEPNEQQHDG